MKIGSSGFCLPVSNGDTALRRKAFPKSPSALPACHLAARFYPDLASAVRHVRKSLHDGASENDTAGFELPIRRRRFGNHGLKIEKLSLGGISLAKKSIATANQAEDEQKKAKAPRRKGPLASSFG